MQNLQNINNDWGKPANRRLSGGARLCSRHANEMVLKVLWVL
jgi:hypothetical protein